MLYMSSLLPKRICTVYSKQIKCSQWHHSNLATSLQKLTLQLLTAAGVSVVARHLLRRDADKALSSAFLHPPCALLFPA